MNEISVITNRTYAKSRDYLPLLNTLGDSLCVGYGSGFPRKYVYTNEPVDKMFTPIIPNYIRTLLVSPFCKVIKAPNYYPYYSTVVMLDHLFEKKVSKDESKIVLATPLLCNSIIRCKEAGKTVITVAENSEPLRELKRISDDYRFYNIKSRYIYGDERWQNRVDSGFKNSDFIITISEVSQNTYRDAGYDMSKITLIAKNGTDHQSERRCFDGKRKAFITTAFHSFIKGTHRLLLAWKKAKIEDIPLVVVGRLCDDMKEFIEKNGPFDNVIFTGHRSDLSTWYMEWDAVGVLMSLSEGGSKVIAEMMSYGFPMLVSPDATCDLVVDDVNGYIVDPYDEDKLVEKLIWLSKNWEKVNSMRDDCYKTASEKTMGGWAQELGQHLLSFVTH